MERSHDPSTFRRSDPPVERSMFKVDSFAFRGPAMYAQDEASEKFRYRKLDREAVH